MRFHLKNKFRRDIDPDEIFLDSKNLPSFNTQQFEGRLEKPIPKKTVFILSMFFLFFFILFTLKIGNLQIVKGESLFKKSENNTLLKQPIFADRGLIYDRNDVLLAWNSWNEDNINKFSSAIRTYTKDKGFGLLLGYVSTPTKDNSGKYWQEAFIGKDGVEKSFNDFLTGENGSRIIEVDVKGKVQSENIILPPKLGNNMKLTIDSRIQKKMYESIENMAKNAFFNGGAGVLMDIENGEVLAITSYPEYDPNILSSGDDTKTINSYLIDKRKVFLNRPLSGLYAPGSIVKPFFGYGALFEKVITPTKLILSNGSISIPNPYFPGKKTVFNDHGTFGYVDMRKAISVSSDVYFYQVGGGFENQKGIGILNIDKYAKMFGFTEKTGIDIGKELEGIIPNPEWKAKTFKGDIWRVGDTYNSAIGQYGFQVTPISMARAVSGIASMSYLSNPHVSLETSPDFIFKTPLSLDKEYLKIIHEGMRMAVTEGTAVALNLPNVKVAAKSGTAQVGYGNTNTNSWIIGFFPYENPKYSFAILLERGPKSASGNSTRVMSEIINYMATSTPEYFK